MAETSSELAGRAEAAPRLPRMLTLWITNASHALNHFQNQMVAVLYPVILTQLGFGYAQLGVITAVRNLLGSGMQVIYGFLVPFTRRTILLGAGNLVLAAGTVLTGFTGSYLQFLGAWTLASAGSSAQHPVGSSLLAGAFPRTRGTVLALHNSIGGIGSLLAPTVAALLLPVLGWRGIFVAVACASLGMATAFVLVRNRVDVAGTSPQTNLARLRQSGASCLRVVRNRNMLVISLVMMAGAAGRGEGVDVTYLGPHLVCCSATS